MSNTTGLPRNRGHSIAHVTSRGERSCAGEKIEKRKPKKRMQAEQPPPPATRQQATNLRVQVCRLGVVAATASCCSYAKTCTWARQRGTGYQKGGGSRIFRQPGRQGGTYLSALYVLAAWDIFVFFGGSPWQLPRHAMGAIAGSHATSMAPPYVLSNTAAC